MNQLFHYPIAVWSLVVLVCVISPCLLCGITAWLINNARKAERGAKRDAIVWSIVNFLAFIILAISLTLYVFRPPQSIFVGGALSVLFALIQIRLSQVATNNEKHGQEPSRSA